MAARVSACAIRRSEGAVTYRVRMACGLVSVRPVIAQQYCDIWQVSVCAVARKVVWLSGNKIGEVKINMYIVRTNEHIFL